MSAFRINDPRSDENTADSRNAGAEAQVRACLERIEARDAEIGAWEVVDREGALRAAKTRDQAGHRGLLQGIPIGVKDIIDVCGLPTRMGTPIYEANVAGTQNLLSAARDADNLQRFVHVSTCDVYGYPRVPCDESHPLTDIGLPYNSTKCQGEAAVWKARKDFGMPVAILRPATIYGPRGKAFVIDIADLLRQGWMAYIDSGKAPGGFSYVDNVVDAMIQASSSDGAEGHAFNIADGTGATWTDYLCLFAVALGRRPPWINLPFPIAMTVARAMEFPYTHFKFAGRPLLTRHAVYLLGFDQEFPTEKARRIFAFSPTIGLAEGVERSVAWLKASGNA